MGKKQAPSGPVDTRDPMAQQQAGQLRSQQFQQAILEANRRQSMEEGRRLGQEIFGPGTLQRLREGRSQEQADLLAGRRAFSDVAGRRSQPMQNILASREAGLGGYSSPQYNALRQRAYEGVQSNLATNLRGQERAQSRNFVSGAAAAAQIAKMRQAAQAEATRAERDLMISDIEEQQKRLGAYEQSARGAEDTEFGRAMQAQSALEGLQEKVGQEELAREQFNIGQAQREKAGQLQSTLGLMGMGAGDFASAAQAAIANQQMGRSLQPSGGGKGK